MKRKVHLVGEMGERFGNTFEVYADTLEHVFSCIDSNVEGFKHYITECYTNNLGISISVEDEEIQEVEKVLLPLKKGDITMAITPAGAGGDSGIFEVLLAAVMFIFNPYAGVKLTTAAMKINAFLYTTVMTSLASKGMQKLMAPDPAEDEDEPTNYLYQGSDQNIISGDPVPILYGELIIPGQNISMFTQNGKSMSNPVHKMDSAGNIDVSNEGS